MKIQIPAQTVNVDAAAWAIKYGINITDVRADVKNYFDCTPQQIVDGLGLGETET